MSLPIMLALLVCGIAGIALLRHRAGHARPFRIESETVARREWGRHWPDDWVQAVHLAGDAALIDGRHGVGLLRVLGADTVAHRVAQMQPVSGGLRLDFADFAAPGITLPLPEATATDWLMRWQAGRG
jgi:hypothetical protein